MKKVILGILFILVLSPLWSADRYRLATVSFVSGLVANFGFTDEYVGDSDSIKPAELEGDITFTYDEANERIVTASHRIYWQIFTTDKVSLTAEATPLTGIGQNGNQMSITWTDRRENLKCGGTTTIYADEQGENPIRSNSVPFRIELVNSSLSGINWSQNYTGTITLKLQVVS